MRNPASCTRRALSGSCAENRDTVWIVPVLSTLLTGDTSELTKLYAPNEAWLSSAGSLKLTTSPATMKYSFAKAM